MGLLWYFCYMLAEPYGKLPTPIFWPVNSKFPWAFTVVLLIVTSTAWLSRTVLSLLYRLVG